VIGLERVAHAEERSKAGTGYELENGHATLFSHERRGG
jgi:hypothetical protein